MTATAAPPRNRPAAESLEDLAIRLMTDEAAIAAGDPKAIERQHAKGRLTARERIARLLDPRSEFFELGIWAAFAMYEDVGGAPAAGLIVGIGRIERRTCLVIANDATVKAGAFFPATAKKFLRAQHIAMENRLPVVYLVDSAGVFLPMQDEVFPDQDDFGRIFRNNAVMSAMGIPQFAAIMGNCVAGGAYLPVLCDKLLMTEGSGLYLAGPALVKAAIGQSVTSEELGGAAMHAQVSGTVDFREADDPACLKRLRSLVGLLPEDPVAAPYRCEKESAPPRDPSDVFTVIPRPPGGEYDVRDLMATIVDADSLSEYKPEFGQTIVCAYARISGYPVGVVANQCRRCQPKRGPLQFGRVIYHDSADKAARFIMDCNQAWLPIVFLCDVNGFMVGRDSEQEGIIRAGAKMVNAVSNCVVPKITVITGGSFGAGNYAMCGKAFDPRFIFAWPTCRYAVMGADQAANTLFEINLKALERDGKPHDVAEIQALRDRVRAEYEAKVDVRHAAAAGWVDKVIDPAKTRKALALALSCVVRAAPRGEFKTGVIQV